MRFRRSLSLVLLACSAFAAACSTSGGAGDAADPKTPPPGSDSGPCPSNVVFQADWFPEVEQGGTYQLIGAGGTIDAEGLTYSGPLRNRYKGSHGVQTVEIRAGGAAIDNKSVIDAMADDPDIDFGFVSTDDVIVSGGTEKSVMAVTSTLDISPQMLMWSPARYTITEFSDLAKTRAPVLHFPGLTYIDYLVDQGYVTADQADATYNGSPERWLASNGDVIQQGFATNEVYTYTELLEDWRHPVDFFLFHWMGYENYPSAIAVRTAATADPRMRDCLAAFVPVMQQAWVDFLAEPDATADELIDINARYGTFFQLSKGLNDRALEMFSEFSLATNGKDTTYGNFDVSRMNRLFDIVKEVYAERGTPLPDTLRPADAYTNDFIDPAIGLAAAG
ncbi:MAG: ABC transporter substrate-binding protein [Acidimicrobiia bacterium]